ncbi:MAG: UDP-N-acetylmuramoyl-L-alanyl-D-glutamate--2,6-diaminopimelate ligase [Lentisphaerae bacterium]|nr:UDP-N-acetylmuramoyl-L-alanyl-D-glutamate--2,6-diaminopimelate ligase [Lentisphaerota bacterium]
MKLDALLSETPVLETAGRAGREVLGVVSDSRQVKPGYVFVAIAGRRADGWSYADEAARRGAVAIVSRGDVPPRRDVCHVRVADPRRAVADLARAFHGNPSARLRLAGVTGTNGKTTTTYMIYEALRAAGRRPGLIGTVEYRIGTRVIPASRTTPEAPDLQAMLAQMAGAGGDSAVMEVSSHALAQQRVLGMEFDAAVFTNLTRDHLDYHNTMEEYFEAKALLFRDLARGAKAAVSVINRDDPWGRRLIERHDPHRALLTYGVDPAADVRAEEVRLTSHGSAFVLRSPWGAERCEIRLLGWFNVSNALAAAAACGALGVAPGVTAGALAAMRRVPGRLEEIETDRGFQVFVDYAHTDDALEHVLRTLRPLCAGALSVVFGCGGDRDRGKRPAMGRVAAELADRVIITSDNPRSEDPAEIIAQVRAGCGAKAAVETIVDRREAIARALDAAGRGDVVLVAGKGHENYQEFARTTVPFDDRQAVRDALGKGPADGRETHARL